jgi:ATP/maltotriose-dependent transcriptional regulator MalT
MHVADADGGMDGLSGHGGSVPPAACAAIGATTYPAHGTIGSVNVGRAAERALIADALAAVRAGEPRVLVLEGEPGIGKSHLLAHLAQTGREAGATVLAARASAFEGDLPYALVADALDGHLAAAAPRRLERLGLTDPAALAGVLPALGGLAPGAGAPDRHRTQRALRDLLERLAAPRPLALCLDDVHWADPASLDALTALVARPPSAAVLLALAARENQLPPPLGGALAEALRAGRAVTLTLTPLSPGEAAELVGRDVAGAVYAQAGGNPFYLEQLARVPPPPAPPPHAAAGAGAGAVPAAVAAALAAELAALDGDVRRLLDAAGVVGDPFEPALAAIVAELSDAAGLAALDALLGAALVRPADGPRRFAFRHPVVRQAVYDALPGGWRLGAHARAAEALAVRGAGAVERAHHVAHAAVPGDDRAVALLSEAAAELQGPAPAIAARFHAAALALVPDTPEQRPQRARLQARLADAQAAGGDPAAARRTLIDALRSAPAGARLLLTVALANQEWWLGDHEDARRRLHVALGDLPAAPSPDRVRLRLALSLTALLAGDLRDAADQASDARDDARAIGDPAFEVAALAGGAVAGACAAAGGPAEERLEASAAALERLDARRLATRLPAFWMHARAHRALGRFEAALAGLDRGAALAAETGRERVLLVLTLERVPALLELGRLAAATAAAEEGLERARPAGNPRILLWALSLLAAARLAAGDVTDAVRHAEAAAALGVRPDFHAAGQPAWCLGAALTAAGNPDRAAAAMRAGFGGPELAALVPADRPAAAADLVAADLARGDVAAAATVLAVAEAAAARAGTGWARAQAALARSAVLLARGRAGEAAAAAAEAHAAAGSAAPLTAARAQLAHGRALAAAGRRAEAAAALTAAEAALDGFGALRERAAAARELRRLGRRVVRSSAAAGGDPLTAREREIAELVAAGRTNREIAGQLVLSTRTVEAHLRSIYAKLGVRSRVELARAGR